MTDGIRRNPGSMSQCSESFAIASDVDRMVPPPRFGVSIKRRFHGGRFDDCSVCGSEEGP